MVTPTLDHLMLSHPGVYSPTVTVKPASPDSIYFVGVTIAEKVMSG